MLNMRQGMSDMASQFWDQLAQQGLLPNLRRLRPHEKDAARNHANANSDNMMLLKAVRHITHTSHSPTVMRRPKPPVLKTCLSHELAYSIRIAHIQLRLWSNCCRCQQRSLRMRLLPLQQWRTCQRCRSCKRTTRVPLRDHLDKKRTCWLHRCPPSGRTCPRRTACMRSQPPARTCPHRNRGSLRRRWRPMSHGTCRQDKTCTLSQHRSR